MLIASEGDEVLAGYITTADWLALIASCLVLALLVAVLTILRNHLAPKFSMRLVVNTVFVLALLAAAAAYYNIYVAFSKLFVLAAIRQRAEQAHVTLPEYVRDFAQTRAQSVLGSPNDFICVYPGWLVLLIPCIATPSLVVILTRRQNVASAGRLRTEASARDREFTSATLRVRSHFEIAGRGAFVCGELESGVLRIGDRTVNTLQALTVVAVEFTDHFSTGQSEVCVQFAEVSRKTDLEQMFPVGGLLETHRAA